MCQPLALQSCLAGDLVNILERRTPNFPAFKHQQIRRRPLRALYLGGERHFFADIGITEKPDIGESTPEQTCVQQR